MKKRRILLLGLCLLLLAGCTGLRENNSIADLPSLSPITYETGKDTRTVNPSLYFLDESTGRLVAESRELEISYMADGAELILEELLAGPSSSSLSPVLSGATLAGVEQTDECANVYVETEAALSSERMFTAAVAIADTMIDFTGVTYVTVFFNGEVMNIDGYAFGPLRKSDGNPSALYTEYRARYAENVEGRANTVELSVILYFVDPSGRLLLPEVRTVTVTNGDYVGSVLSALADGPRYKYELRAYLSKEKLEATAYTVSEEDRQLGIQFEGDVFAGERSSSRNLEAAGIFYTLAGVVPDTYRLVLKDDVNTYVMTRQVAAQYLGQNIRISLPDSGMTSLLTIKRTVEADYDYYAYIAELMRGPIESDSVEVWPVFPENITMDDLNSIHVYENMAVVDFSAAFFEQVDALSPERQYMLVYSIVNTLAATSNIRAVLFQADGGPVGELSGGISLSSPLMPNPGIEN